MNIKFLTKKEINSTLLYLLKILYFNGPLLIVYIFSFYELFFNNLYTLFLKQKPIYTQKYLFKALNINVLTNNTIGKPSNSIYTIFSTLSQLILSHSKHFTVSKIYKFNLLLITLLVIFKDILFSYYTFFIAIFDIKGKIEDLQRVFIFNIIIQYISNIFKKFYPYFLLIIICLYMYFYIYLFIIIIFFNKYPKLEFPLSIIPDSVAIIAKLRFNNENLIKKYYL